MSRILGASKVTAKYQVTIPEGVREFLNVKIGDQMAFIEEKNKIYIMTKVELKT